jgi:hypothetical protein
MSPDDRWPCCYSADTSEAKAKELAAKALGVPEEQVELLETGGCWLAKEKQKDE